MSTDAARAALMGNELTQAVDETVAAFGCTDAQRIALGNLLAAVLGRVTSLAASKVVEAHRLVERVEALEAREAGRG